MKNIMRIMSVLILFIAIILTITTIFDMGLDFNTFAAKIMIIFAINIMSFISLAACSYCLERNDNNYLTRIIPIYVTIPIILTTIIVFFNVNDEFIIKALLFLITSSVSVSLFSITMIIKPNNQITNAIKVISIISIAVCCVFNVISVFNLFDKNVTFSLSQFNNSNNLNFLSIQNSYDNIDDLIRTVASIVEFFSVILLFTTNYAFSSTIELEDGDIDYEAVKKDAMSVVNRKMNERYNLNPKEETPIINQNNNGLMNINNQLGTQSNVGNVKEKAKEVNVQESLDSVMSFSNGPVVNNTINTSETKEIKNENLNNQNNTDVQPNQEQINNQNIQNINNTLPQNVDIQNVMMQQQGQTQNNINPQMQNQNIPQSNNNQLQNSYLNNNSNNQNKFIN